MTAKWPLSGYLTALFLLALWVCPPHATAAESPWITAVPDRRNVSDTRPVPGSLDYGESRWTIDHGAEGIQTPAGKGTDQAPAGTDQFLRDQAEALGLSENALDELVVQSVRTSPVGVHVEYQQVRDGLPVFNGGVEVHRDRSEDPAAVHNQYVPGTSAVSRFPFYDSQAIQDVLRTTARQKLRERDPSPGSLQLRQTRLGYFYDGRETHLAYRTVVTREHDPRPYRLVVDANSGDALQFQRLFFTRPLPGGNVFRPSNAIYASGDLTLTDRNDTNEGFSDKYTEVPLETTPRNGYHYLANDTVVISDWSGNGRIPLRQLRDSGGDFYVERRPDTFEAVMAFKYISDNRNRVGRLGFDGLLIDTPLEVDINVDGIGYNAYFSPIGPTGDPVQAYSDSGVDKAEDADIIVHEYGHYLHWDLSNSAYLVNGFQPKAQAEGFADYWAATNTPDVHDSSDSALQMPCMGEWGSNYVLSLIPSREHCLRWFDRDLVWPDDRVNEIHLDGRIWSKALWMNRKLTWSDDDLPDRLSLAAHTLVPDSPTFGEGATAYLFAQELTLSDNGLPYVVIFDGAIWDGDEDNLGAVCRNFHQRGFDVASGCIPTETWHSEERGTLHQSGSEGLADAYQITTGDSGFDVTITVEHARNHDVRLGFSDTGVGATLDSISGFDTTVTSTATSDSMSLSDLPSGTYSVVVQSNNSGTYVLTTSSPAIDAEGGGGGGGGSCLIQRTGLASTTVNDFRALRDVALHRAPGRFLTALYYDWLGG